MAMRISLLWVGVLLVACNAVPEEQVAPARPSPNYYYYPKANVYYDSANAEYLFMGADARTWLTQTAVPPAMQTLLDKSVRIPNPAQPVWKDNGAHKLLYSAILYASPADTALPKKAPVVPVVAPAADTAVKKERKGIKRIFDKIFGRKK